MTMLDKVYEGVDSLKQLAVAARDSAIKVKDVSFEINNSWSQSTLLRHAKFYFGNYEEPPAHQQFNIEWGLIRGTPTGWYERSAEEVREEIERRSKVDVEELKQDVTRLESGFEKLKRDASLALIDAGFQDVSAVEGFEFRTATDHFNNLNPTSFMTRDSAAIASGRYVAPHIYYRAIAMSALGIEEEIDKFAYVLRKLGGSQKVAKSNGDFWDLIHPDIRNVSEKQFRDGHYLDAVRSAFIEVNDKVKKKYKKDTGVEEDGFNLMKLAFGDFGASSSTFNGTAKYSLADLSTESGRNFQKGFSLISAGAVLGLRNPRAHENAADEKDKAVHLLFLASWLMLSIFPASQK